MDSGSKTSEGSELPQEPEPSVVIPPGDLVADGVRILDFGEGTHLYSISDVGLRVDVSNYGATVVSALVPDREGKVDDVLLGFDDSRGITIYNFNISYNKSMFFILKF